MQTGKSPSKRQYSDLGKSCRLPTIMCRTIQVAGAVGPISMEQKCSPLPINDMSPCDHVKLRFNDCTGPCGSRTQPTCAGAVFVPCPWRPHACTHARTHRRAASLRRYYCIGALYNINGTVVQSSNLLLHLDRVVTGRREPVQPRRRVAISSRAVDRPIRALRQWRCV